jgi:hypothetical protein
VEKMGDRDPYFGVLADDQFKLTAITDQVRKKFFDSGQPHIDRLLSQVHGHHGDIKQATALISAVALRAWWWLWRSALTK